MNAPLFFTLAFLSLLFLGPFAYIARAHVKTLRWPGVRGRIVSRRIHKTRLRHRNVHYPRIVYSYEVAGRSYTGERIRANHEVGASPALGERFLASHPVGGEIMVFYDPAAPEHAVLERKLGFVWFLLVPGVPLALLALSQSGLFG